MGLSIGFFVEAIDPPFLLAAVEAHFLAAACVLVHSPNYTILNYKQVNEKVRERISWGGGIKSGFGIAAAFYK